jgi:hypothetical protein
MTGRASQNVKQLSMIVPVVRIKSPKSAIRCLSFDIGNNVLA